MALHPDERPRSMEELGNVLFGTRDFPTGPLPRRALQRSAWEYLTTPPESNLVLMAGALLLVSLLATLLR